MLPEHISKVLNAVQKPVISSKGLIEDFAIFIVTQLYMLVRAHASIEFFPHETFDFLVEKFYC